MTDQTQTLSELWFLRFSLRFVYTVDTHLFQVGLLNVGGFYDSLLKFFDYLTAEGFVRPEARGLVLSSSDPAELIELLEVSHTSRGISWTCEQQFLDFIFR